MKRILIFVMLFMILVSTQGYALECRYALKPEFSNGRNFTHGITLVHKDGQSAVIDMFGNYVVDFDERYKLIRSNGLIMIVGENDMAAFFYKDGKQLTDYVYDTYPVTDAKWQTKDYMFVYSLQEGDGKSSLVPFSRGKKYGYINEYGHEIVPPKYGYAGGFYNGIACIMDEGILHENGRYTNSKYGLINDEGKEILPSTSYWTASSVFDYGYSYATNGPGSQVIANKEGTVLHAGENGYANIGARYYELFDNEGRTGIASADGAIIIPLDYYTGISRLNGDYFIVDNCIVNNKNEVIFKAPDGMSLSAHYTGTVEKSCFARITAPDPEVVAGKFFGLVNTDGQIIIEPVYYSCYDLGEGLIYARDKDTNYLFDYSGKRICTLNGNNVGKCIDGVFSIVDFDTMKTGYLLNPIVYPNVFINGEELICDVYPKIEDGRTLVPLRAIMENTGCEVNWDEDTWTASVKAGDDTVTIKPGEKVLYKNGEAIEIDVPAKIENSRTLIPLRAIMEAFDYKVEWNEVEREVNIIS